MILVWWCSMSEALEFSRLRRVFQHSVKINKKARFVKFCKGDLGTQDVNLIIWLKDCKMAEATKCNDPLSEFSREALRQKMMFGVVFAAYFYLILMLWMFLSAVQHFPLPQASSSSFWMSYASLFAWFLLPISAILRLTGDASTRCASCEPWQVDREFYKRCEQNKQWC